MSAATERAASGAALFGAESTRRPDSLQRAGASGDQHQLLVRPGIEVETLDEEALGDERGATGTE